MLRSKTTTTKTGGRDRAAALKQLRLASGSYVTVGVHDDAVYPDGTSVAMVAMVHEFGTDDIPERSFIRSAIYGEWETINGWREEVMRNIISGDWSAEKGLKMLGFRLQELIRNKIKSNIPPPNSKATRARKERLGVPQRTLIETGHLLASVTYRIHLAEVDL